MSPIKPPFKLICLVLAAGSSSRFGKADKRFAKLTPDKTLLAQTLENIQASGLAYQCVVQASDVQHPLLSSIKQHCLIAKDAELGMGHSLASAINLLKCEYTAFLICLGDMPYIKPQTYQAVAEALQATSQLGVIPHLPHSAAVLNNAGHPIGIQGELIQDFCMLAGDKGGKHLLKAKDNFLSFLTVDDMGIHQDIDTPEQLQPL